MNPQTYVMKLLYIGYGERRPVDTTTFDTGTAVGKLDIITHTFYPKIKRANCKPHKIITKLCLNKYVELIDKTTSDSSIGVILSGHGQPLKQPNEDWVFVATYRGYKITSCQELIKEMTKIFKIKVPQFIIFNTCLSYSPQTLDAWNETWNSRKSNKECVIVASKGTMTTKSTVYIVNKLRHQCIINPKKEIESICAIVHLMNICIKGKETMELSHESINEPIINEILKSIQNIETELTLIILTNRNRIQMLKEIIYQTITTNINSKKITQKKESIKEFIEDIKFILKNPEMEKESPRENIEPVVISEGNDLYITEEKQILKKQKTSNSIPPSIPTEKSDPKRNKTSATMIAPRMIQTTLTNMIPAKITNIASENKDISSGSAEYISENTMETEETQGNNYAIHALNKYLADYFKCQENTPLISTDHEFNELAVNFKKKLILDLENLVTMMKQPLNIIIDDPLSIKDNAEFLKIWLASKGAFKYSAGKN